MLKNYLTIALRTVRRHKGYAFINLFGLAIGIACFLLVVLYVQHELSFDTYHEKEDRIYRLVSYSGFAEKQWGSYVTGDPIPEMRDTYTDVADATKYMHCGADRIQVGQEVYRDIKMLCAEPNLFNLFSFDLVQGDATSVLDRPNTAVITRSLAQRLFGDKDPVGESIPIQFDRDERLFEIMGLMEDVPAITHFTFDMLLSYESLRTTRRCLTCGQPMYALLAEDADPEDIAARVLTLLRDVQGKEHIEDLRLEPLADIHFSDVRGGLQGDIRYVYLLSAIALVILLIACANYMNLATARAGRRTREVGVRKVLGAHRFQVARQFLLEALMLTMLALPLAVGFLVLALPSFNTLAEAEVVIAWAENSLLYGAIVGIIMVVGLLAGSYPALFLSVLRPVAVLRGRWGGSTGAWFRKGLVVFQFTASIALIAITSIILQQLEYMQTKKLGFDAEQVVMIRVADPVLSKQPETLKQEFLRHARVTHATAGYALPGQMLFQGARYIHQPEGKEGPKITFVKPVIDADFLETMQVSLIAGRNIADEKPESGPETLINEAGLKAMGWTSPDEALGDTISWGPIVGVVEDFHFQSLHQEILPLVMSHIHYGDGRVGQVALRIAGDDVQNTLAALEDIWKGFGTDMPFEFSFLTDELNQLYEQEQRAARVFGLFAGLAILIACLGLLGLAAFSAERRTKEIGIRKVLGATVRNIIVLLSRDFVRLVLVAFVVAVPVAYLAMQRWLEDFAFRIELGPAVFALAGGGALLIALLTVSFQAIRAAMTNPVDSLRYE